MCAILPAVNLGSIKSGEIIMHTLQKNSEILFYKSEKATSVLQISYIRVKKAWMSGIQPSAALAISNKWLSNQA
jgi:hypothetical protein